MIEWLISFGNGCHYITMAFLLLYLLWLVRESFRTRKSGVVREEIMYSDDAGKCFLALCLEILDRMAASDSLCWYRKRVKTQRAFTAFRR